MVLRAVVGGSGSSGAASITSGTIDGATIGGINPAPANFTDVVLKTLGWSASGASPMDVALLRDGPNSLTQRNGTNAQGFRVANTWTDASNGEFGVMDWTTTPGTLTIGTAKLGTGTNRTLVLTTGGNINFALNNVPQVLVSTGVLGFCSQSNGNYSLGSSTLGWKRLFIDYTNTGTVGAVTINKAAGRVNIAAAGTSVVVTNSLCTVNAHVFANITTTDGTAKTAQVTPAAGSFTITLNTSATGQVAIDFFIVNAD
jgi:hypothetical protein